ncbi:MULTISPECIES: hypothetical protein [unclassified Cupriavidus]|uniref:hypothetical protein n=1 Tax=unclassified Cupriavidus TaxID=2640874 RepID=UPI001C0002E3|nr:MULTISPECIES: hypothetical protein [unclassified Cupriavidus]MCA3184302.1 hypothetical protein [Cupriavidus sp.]MCA3190968.1 hypothetical protein [Cupriavidus sp.]MCA3199312.1 hypothetical protein [Cupriavidus sp.]MCA3204579.1 hypothetical protein [Cupriavidus sp.]MCA3209052.1 hypothetical protein [Cupriavidus sp.]
MTRPLPDQTKPDSRAVLTELNKRRREHEQHLIQEAARRGVSLGFTASHAYEKNSPNAGLWPMTLTDLLIANPDRAKESNESLLAEVTTALQLAKPLKKEIMSRPISPKQRTAVNDKLTRAGYGAGIQTMTQAKRSVRSGKASMPTEEMTTMEHSSKITYLADGIIINGEQYSYVKARRVATGNPLRDLTVRMHGACVPLSVVVASAGATEAQALRGIAAAAAIAAKREAERAERAAATAEMAHRIAEQAELDAIAL